MRERRVSLQGAGAGNQEAGKDGEPRADLVRQEASASLSRNAPYKDLVSLADRKMMALRVQKRHPNHVPIIAETSDAKLRLDKRKLLCPKRMRIAEFMAFLRRRLRAKGVELHPREALYIFIANVVPPSNDTLEDAYERHSDEDGLLYVFYNRENTFGSGLL